MSFDELVDISVYHPLRYHRESVTPHCDSQQQKHVRVLKRSPCHDFFAEPLRIHKHGEFLVCVVGKFWAVTHIYNLIKVARRIYSQNLDRDLTALILAHPNIGEPTAVGGVVKPVVTRWDLQRPRK